MSAQSGISVSQDLLEVFAESSDPESDVLFLKVEIENNEDFAVQDRAIQTGDMITDWELVAKAIDAKNPCYILFNPARDDGKWIVIAWVPPKAKPGAKMLYASSREALKNGLSRTKFAEDYFINAQDECSYDAYMDAITTYEEKDDVRTWEENLKRQAALDSITTRSSVKQSAMATLDIPVSEEATRGFEALQSGSKNCAFFSLNGDTEELLLEESCNCEVQDLSGRLTRTDPRFILFNFDHTNEGVRRQSLVFIYYCPEAAHPKAKMFYSTTVQNMNGLCEQHGLEVIKKIEISEPQETGEENIRYELYPKKVEKKLFAKPGAPGRRGGRGKVKRKKWTAS